MVYMNRSAVFVLFLVFSACASPILKDDELRGLNRELESTVYTATADLTADFSQEASKEVIFKKGEKLKFFLEGGSDWIRLKAVRASERREQAIARTLMFVLREDIKGEDGPAEIRARIAKLAVSK